MDPLLLQEVRELRLLCPLHQAGHSSVNQNFQDKPSRWIKVQIH